MKWMLAVGLLLLAGADARAAEQQYSPKHPKVVTAVENALKGLARHFNDRAGANALRGLCFFKQYRDPEHAEVARALKAMQPFLAIVREGKTPDGSDLASAVTYDLAVSIVFLVELDPTKYREPIEQLIARLIQVQKVHGGWGYLNRETGDTSMTQYAVLAMWEAARAGFDVPPQSWEGVANYLVRTQDPSGQWPYQGVPTTTTTLNAQEEVRTSMTVAALGALYMCLDVAGWKSTEEKLPEGLIPVGLAGRGVKPPTLPRKPIVDAIDRGEKWLFENFTIKPTDYQFTHYYLFSVERYASFRALVRQKDDLPFNWYDEGVEHLLSTQRRDGTFFDFNTVVPATSFGVLFMIRSTQRTIEQAPHRFGGGVLVGGRGLPGDESDVQLVNGRVRAKPLQGPGEKLLDLLDDPTHPQFAAARAGVLELVDEADEATLKRQEVRLRKLLAQPDPELRAIGMRALGKVQSLDGVPMLITGLSDPEPEVQVAAEETLRLLRRQLGGAPFRGFGSAEERGAAIERWKQWYLTIRPDAASEFDVLR